MLRLGQAGDVLGALGAQLLSLYMYVEERARERERERAAVARAVHTESWRACATQLGDARREMGRAVSDLTGGELRRTGKRGRGA